MLRERITSAMALTDALADGLSAEDLARHNGEARSNTIGEQFWCIVGARESYAKAIEAGQWQGFSCSLTDTGTPATVRAALASSRADVVHRLQSVEDPDSSRDAILIDLLEHEVQHHGQLIRYFYANGLTFPAPFAERYSLD